MTEWLRRDLRSLKILAACAAMLGALAACSMPTTRGYVAEANESPVLWLLSPLWLPMGALYDGVGAATGATPQDISNAVNLVVDTAGAGMAIYGASQGIGGGSAYAPPTYTGGYSQRQAFDDCARNYQGVSPQLEAQCRQSGANLQSMGPMLERQPDGQFQRQCGAHGCK